MIAIVMVTMTLMVMMVWTVTILMEMTVMVMTVLLRKGRRHCVLHALEFTPNPLISFAPQGGRNGLLMWLSAAFNTGRVFVNHLAPMMRKPHISLYKGRRYPPRRELPGKRYVTLNFDH